MPGKRKARVLNSCVIVRTGIKISVEPRASWELMVYVEQKAGKAGWFGTAALEPSPAESDTDLKCDAPRDPGPDCPKNDHRHPLVGWDEAIDSGQITIDSQNDYDRCTLSLSVLQERKHRMLGVLPERDKRPLDAAAKKRKKRSEGKQPKKANS